MIAYLSFCGVVAIVIMVLLRRRKARLLECFTLGLLTGAFWPLALFVQVYGNMIPDKKDE